MEPSRKPLAKVEGRGRLRRSGLTVAWRGTPSLDDWVAYIVKSQSKKLILAGRVSLSQGTQSCFSVARTVKYGG